MYLQESSGSPSGVLSSISIALEILILRSHLRPTKLDLLEVEHSKALQVTLIHVKFENLAGRSGSCLDSQHFGRLR